MRRHITRLAYLWLTVFGLLLGGAGCMVGLAMAWWLATVNPAMGVPLLAVLAVTVLTGIIYLTS